jgi:LacI family transcriptional regulator
MTEGVSKKLARTFREKIQTGQWPVGERVPTTRELAASYGVSVNTIQNAFRELEASDLVERKPRLGGFVKSRPGSGGAVRSQATTVAVVGPFTDVDYSTQQDGWGTRIIRGCDRELSEGGYHIAMFSYASDDAAALSKVLAHVDRTGESLAGVFCFLRPEILGLLEELDKRDIPWVSINRPGEHAAQNFVAHDAFEGGRLIGGCFARMGLKRVAVLSDPIETGRSSGDKLFGCIRGYVDNGGQLRDVDFINCHGHDEPAGYEHFAAYADKFGPPQAVLCSGDLLALGVLRVCRERNLRVPEDVGVIGSTGLQLAAYAHPALTVLEVPMERMGREAGRMLFEMAREGVRRMMGRFVPGSLVVRESFKVSEQVLAEVREAMARTP